MVVFPWLVLVVGVVAAAIGMLLLASRLWVRFGRHEPLTVGVASVLLVALPLLVLILAWGIVLKPR